jgi:hypothetical protein
MSFVPSQPKVLKLNSLGICYIPVSGAKPIARTRMSQHGAPALSPINVQ